MDQRTGTRAARLAPAERRAQLLDVASQLLEAGGSDALRMDAVARSAGVTRPVVYEHFGDREGLIVALIEKHGARLDAGPAQEGEAALPPRRAATGAGSTSLEDEVAAGVRWYLAQVRTQGAALRGLLRSAGMSPRVEQARSAIWIAATERWATRYREEVDIDPVEARALAAFHLHGLWALADQHLAGTLSARHVERLHLAIVRSSLKAVAADRSR
jgi:AcrR family transcriptional regulator